MNSTLKNQIEKTLALVFSDFKNENEAHEFMKNFLTEKELENLSKRFAVGYWLLKKRSYENIKNNLKVSSATIAGVQDLLKKESFKKAYKKIEAEDWATKKSLQIRRLSLIKKLLN